MTPLLEKAIEEVRKLSQADQDAIAAIILEEIEDEQKWETAFANSLDELEKLSQKAIADVRAGKGHRIGFDEI